MQTCSANEPREVVRAKKSSYLMLRYEKINLNERV